MERVVRLLRGDWVIGSYARWEFRSELADLGYSVTLRDDETMDSLLGHIRRRFLIDNSTPIALTYRLPEALPAPFRNSGPPSDVATDSDVTVFMSIRFCYPQLTLCVTFGAQGVANYQFQCRTPFTVGRHVYLREAANEDERQRNLHDYNDLISGRRIECTVRAMQQIFTEFEMLALHRCHLEMLYSNPIEEPRPRSVPSVSSTTVETDEGNGPNANVTIPMPQIQPRTGPINNNGTTDAADPLSSVQTYAAGTNWHVRVLNTLGPWQFGNAGINFLDEYMQATGPMGGGVDEAMSFGEGGEGFDANNNNVGYGEPYGDDQAMADALMWPEATDNTIVLSSDTSSTGSSGEICLMADFESEHQQALLPGPELNPAVQENPSNPSIPVVTIQPQVTQLLPPEPEETVVGADVQLTQPPTHETSLSLTLACTNAHNYEEGSSSAEGSQTRGGY